MTPQPTPEEAITAPAPWRELPETREEVAHLASQFSDSDLSVAEVLCDRHPADATAFILVDADLAVEHLTFGSLADESRRLASALRQRGVARGDRVGVLMGKSRQLPIVLLALWRLGAIHVPLFTALAGPAIATRMLTAEAVLVVSDPDQRAKLDGIAIPVLESGAEVAALIAASEPLEQSEAIGRDGLFVQLYTSGTTGSPKGVAAPAFAIAAFISYMRYGLDVRDTDVFWNVADPGWAYGLYYALIGPLALGRPNVLLNAGFSTERTIGVIDALGVTNLAAAPTVYRALKKDGARPHTPLRVASSAGEPLTPDVTSWAPGALGADVRDHWGQTEHGMGIVNSWDPRLLRTPEPGSMGQALPGFVAGIIDGSIALSVKESPLMWFRGYVNAPEQTRQRFTADRAWYLTGDVGRRVGDDFFFASRDDDVILAAGYRIAPFDIESIIVTDPSVAEVAVVGRPDPIRGEQVEAFVVLTSDAARDGLESRLQDLVRNGYGAHAYPRRVHVLPSLPKTPSGKVQRFVLHSMSDEEISSSAL